MVCAFAAIAMLIFFIHHISQSVQVSAIVDRKNVRVPHIARRMAPYTPTPARNAQ